MEFNPENVMDMIGTYAGLYGLKILAAIAIFFVGKWLVNMAVRFAERMMHRAHLDITLILFLKNVIKALGLMFVVIATLSQAGVETTSLAAMLAAVGLAIGLALQGSLSNLAAGIMMIIFRPFKVGDYIEGGNTSGTVEDINIFTTTLRSPDNKQIIVPNARITGDCITNYSAKETRRIDMVFGIGYDDDLKKARNIFEKIVAADTRILKEPETQIALSDLADSCVNFVVRPWVKRDDYWDVKFDLTEKVKLALDEAGISIPYPQRDVHVMMDDKTAEKMAGIKTGNDNATEKPAKKTSGKK